MERTTWRRGLVRALPVLAACLVLGGFVASRAIGILFQDKLVRAVNQSTHRRLFIGSVIYRPPFTFYARDVQLLSESGDDSASISASGLEVKLDGIPYHGKPVAIKDLVLRQVIIRTGFGTAVPVEQIGMSLRPSKGSQEYSWTATLEDGASARGHASGKYHAKLRQVDVDQLDLDAHVGPLLAALLTPARDAKMIESLAPDGKFAITGSGNIPLAHPERARYQIDVNLTDATADVERWKAKLKQGNAQIVLRPGASGPGNPLTIEAVLDHLFVAANEGQVRVDGGVATLEPGQKSWRLSNVIGTVQMGRELPFFLPRSGWFFNRGEFRGPVRFTLAASGPLRLMRGQSPFESIHHELLAYPRDVSIRPRNFPQRIEHITGGPIAFRGGIITFQNLSGIYGRDQLLLRQARLTLDDPLRRIGIEDLRSQVKFEEIAGTVIFGQPAPAYPGVIGKTIAQLRPSGPFVVGGGSWYAINRASRFEPWVPFKPDFFIRLMGDGGSFSVTRYQLPLTSIAGEAVIAPLSVDIRQFQSQSMGGTALANGKISPGRPFLYRGSIDLRGINLTEVAQKLPLDGSARERLSGKGAANLQLSGTSNGGGVTAAQTLVLDGECEIIHGDFWSVPTVQEVATRVKRQQDLPVGDAAAVVHIEHEKVSLERAAINSPLLGLLGSGTIGFDKSIDLTVVAAPLGDWRDKLRQAGVPVVGDVLGAIQAVLNAAQGTLLYQFRVTGSLKDPIETIVPAPIITEPIAALFGHMLRQDKNDKLIEDVKKRAPLPQPDTPQAQAAAAQQQSTPSEKPSR